MDQIIQRIAPDDADVMREAQLEIGRTEDKTNGQMAKDGRHLRNKGTTN